MRTSIERELQTRWTIGMDTAMLRRVIVMLETQSPQLIRGAFTSRDGREGCLAHWFGKAVGMSGPQWLASIGLTATSNVVAAWDRDPRFPPQLIRFLKREAFYRGASTPRLLPADLHLRNGARPVHPRPVRPRLKLAGV